MGWLHLHVITERHHRQFEQEAFRLERVKALREMLRATMRRSPWLAGYR